MQYQKIGNRDPLNTLDINGIKVNRYGQRLQQDENTIGQIAGSRKMNGDFIAQNKFNKN